MLALFNFYFLWLIFLSFSDINGLASYPVGKVVFELGIKVSVVKDYIQHFVRHANLID